MTLTQKKKINRSMIPSKLSYLKCFIKNNHSAFVLPVREIVNNKLVKLLDEP